jgi:hypothetical protein
MEVIQRSKEGQLLPRYTRATAHFHSQEREVFLIDNDADTVRLMEESAYFIAPDPMTLYEALNGEHSEEWRDATQKEYDSLIRNGTWELVDPPPGRKIVRNKWVFRTKLNQDGTIDRYKARLCAKGYSQIEGVDFTETYSPTLHKTSMRALLALAALHDWEVEQIDVETAFLNGVLEEEIYMAQPLGYVDKDHPRQVCRLIKSLYGLKQAGRAWRTALDKALTAMNFIHLHSDPCLYVRKGDPTNIIGTHVDDGFITGSTQETVTRTQRELACHFNIKSLGPIKFLLGWEVSRDRANRQIFLSQQGYVEKLLTKFQIGNDRPVVTPMDPSVKLSSADSPATPEDKEEMSQYPYATLIGTLMYLMTCTRPDIAYAVGFLCRFMSNPGKAHWLAATRVIRYLKGTPTLGLTYGGHDATQDLVGWTDSDWAGDLDTYRSTSGFLLTLAGGAVSWTSRRQRTVARSTFEAEYVAASEGASEVQWLRTLLGEINIPPRAPSLMHIADETGLHHFTGPPVVMYCDNQTALAHLKSDMTTQKSKTIPIAYHIVREYIKAGYVCFTFIPTSLQCADAFTKPVHGPTLEHCRRAMGLSPPSLAMTVACPQL